MAKANIINLSESPVPRLGSVSFQVDFIDETDSSANALTPDSITWTLTNRPAFAGDAPIVINSREDVSVSVPASTVHINLDGDDLDFLAAEEDDAWVHRRLTVKIIYDSDLGENRPQYGQCVFKVRNTS